MRKMQVLGIELQDHTVREAMKKTDAFLRDGKVSTIAYITMRGLMEAEGSQERPDFLRELDLTVPADSDILRAAGIATRNRVREVDNDEFLTEFLRKIVRGRQTVYLLTSTQGQLQLLRDGLLSYQENLRIIGSYSLDELEQDDDYLVNEINVETPNVLITNISSPQREAFFEANQMKLNVEVWLMLKDEVVHSNKHKGLFWILHDRVVRKLFKHKVVQYLNHEKES